MKTYISVALLILTLNNPGFGSIFSVFEGSYKHPDYNKRVEFWDIDSALTGTLHKNYLNEYGEETGAKITYYFSFDQVTLKPNKIIGKLITIDSYYGCTLENGPASMEILTSNQIKIIFNQITFDVRKTYQQKRSGDRYRDPVYNHRPSSIQCIIKNRLTTAVVLDRI